MNYNKFDIENSVCEDFVYSFQNISDFRSAFRKKFQYIIAYHATNLSDEELNCVSKNGLKLASKDLLVKKAKHRFIQNSTESYRLEIENYIDEYFSGNELQIVSEINFGLIKSDLFEHYHYLLFGSESLLPVADYLRSKLIKPFRKILVESGSHYIIEVSIPVEKTEDQWIDAIYEYFNQSSSEIPLVYYYNLTIENFNKIEKVNRPLDRQNLILI